MSTLKDVIDVINDHRMSIELFGISEEHAREMSALILALGDQIATDNGMSNVEAATILPSTTELSEDAEIIFEEIKKRVHKD